MDKRDHPGRYDGAPPTLGFLREVNGVTAARVHCVPCGRQVVVPFDRLGLPDATPFPAVRTARRWRCSHCGRRDIAVMPDWPDPRAVHAARVASPKTGP